MLPGFRFLFAAILLSTSILVFGLGAAALLRASHEQYVNNPSWRNGPQEKVFAQSPEPAPPVLAVLRAEPVEPVTVEPVTAEPEPSIRDQVPTIALPASEPEQVAAPANEAEAQPQLAAPPAEVPAVEPAKPEAIAEAAAPASTDTLTAADTTASIPEAKPVGEPAPADPSAALASSALDVGSAKLAALNDPAGTISKDAPAEAKTDTAGTDTTKADAAKTETAKADTSRTDTAKTDTAKPDTAAPDSKATKRKAKAKKRNHVVRRPPPQQLRQQLDPFGRPIFATTTTRTR
ncbi:hypothetical protein NLM27_01350 [Bradyrhizobium sp. CCGB12]|uniref:hypothetical protein n=1 Tax=Bradyrhizobium sp. CCGB12 TaxID=2949632 RepID=UPI0020B2A397|nr:hypothetical protein [Bradyrhizobium sp. CCGB12]MCP3387427.1 hypothetical protein [Bradyrhizobium sp. CCGB12]